MIDQARKYALVSDAIDPDQLDSIKSIISSADGRYELLVVNAQTVFDTLPLEELAVVYISVDVLGESSKTELTPLMSQFCEAARKAPHLEWLQASSVGTDRPQFQQLLQRGVKLTHAGGIAATTVAQSAISGILALGRELPWFLSLQREHRWVPARGNDAPIDLPGQTAIVVGLGAIGQEIARLAKALQLHVIGFNQSGCTPTGIDVETRSISELDKYLGLADWVILSCPLTESTRHLINGRRLSLMKPQSRLVDVSRGGVADSAALLTALRSQTIRGAYLDVFEVEPLPDDSAFWDMPNVIITPHAAGDSRGRGRRLTSFFIQNLNLFLKNQALGNLANY